MKARKPSAAATKRAEQEAKHAAALPDVEAVIKKHGYESVRWVVNRLNEKFNLLRERDETEQKFKRALAEIDARIANKVPEAPNV